MFDRCVPGWFFLVIFAANPLPGDELPSQSPVFPPALWDAASAPGNSFQNQAGRPLETDSRLGIPGVGVPGRDLPPAIQPLWTEPLLPGPIDRLHVTPAPTAAESIAPRREASSGSISSQRLRELMRPTFSLAADWQATASDIGQSSYDARIQFPLYPVFGPPPPLLNAGFSVTNLDAPSAIGLPANLYEASLGLSWVRPVTERWLLRLTLGTAHATDGHNTTSDAWQFRGSLFAVHRTTPQWTWILGAIALGRSDIPAVPAVGAIWQPDASVRFDLTLPKPKFAFLLVDNGPRQQWGYLGAGFDGGTWAYERPGGIDDQLTYRDWRVLLGWESTPTPEPGLPFTRGRKLGAELSYAFAREFEFDSALPDLDLANTFSLRVSTSF